VSDTPNGAIPRTASDSDGSIGILDQSDKLKGMTTSTLSAKQQASSLVAGISRRPRRAPHTPGQSYPVLADIIPLTSAIPSLSHCPVTRAIGTTGRIRLTVGGQTLGDILDWTPGPLSVELRGSWVVLRPADSGRSATRNSGLCSYLDDSRLRVTEAVCTNLGLSFGDEVLVMVIDEENAIALTHPARILTGAPLLEKGIC